MRSNPEYSTKAHYVLARFEPSYLRTNRFDLAGKVRPGRRQRRPEKTGETSHRPRHTSKYVVVASVDAGGMYPDQDLAVFRYRLLYILDAENVGRTVP